MDKLIKELKELMEERGLSLSAVSRALGISSSALSQWLNGIYTGSVAKIDDAVKGLLTREKERAMKPKKELPFLMTSVAKKVFEVARLCHLDGEVGLCYGEAGIGKTRGFKRYGKRNTDVVLIEADLGYTAKVLFSELSKLLVGGDGRGTIHDQMERIVEKLKDSGRLIIVDEAEHLPFRALDLLRRVHDKTGVGILLGGMPRLRENITGRRGEYQQLYSRVGVAMRLEGLRSQDVEEIVGAALPGSNGLWKAYHECCKGNTRHLSKLIGRSMRVAEINDLTVTPDIVREAAKTLII